MPKMKTHRGAAKRFRKTGTGKIRRRKANDNHLAAHKSSRRLRRLRKTVEVSKADAKKITRLLGS